MICPKHDVKFGEGEKCWCCQLLKDTAAPVVHVPIPAGDNNEEVKELEKPKE